MKSRLTPLFSALFALALLPLQGAPLNITDGHVKSGGAITVESGGTIHATGTGILEATTAKDGSILAVSSTGRAGYSASAFVYDEFQRSNRLLQGDIAASGQTWSLTGTGAATANIANGVYTTPSNTYAYLPYGGLISRISAKFIFPAGSDRTTGYMTLHADNGSAATSNNLVKLYHLNFSLTGFNLEKTLTGPGSFQSIDASDSADGFSSTRTWQTYLQAGVEYEGALEFDYTNSLVTVIGPDGYRYGPYHDTDLATIAPANGALQGTGFTGIYIGPAKTTTVPANARDLTIAAGTGIAKTMETRALLYGGVGWYRLATAESVAALTLGGHAYINTFSGSNMQSDDLQMFATDGGVYSFRQEDGYSAGTIPFQKYRISRLSGGGVALDGYLQTGLTTVLWITWRGFFTPVASPVVGATALATETVSLDNITSRGSGTRSWDGKIKLTGLPTSSSGLVSGDVWNDSGTLKIVP